MGLFDFFKKKDPAEDVKNYKQPWRVADPEGRCWQCKYCKTFLNTREIMQATVGDENGVHVAISCPDCFVHHHTNEALEYAARQPIHAERLWPDMHPLMGEVARQLQEERTQVIEKSWFSVLGKT
jgi:hypothetical protein